MKKIIHGEVLIRNARIPKEAKTKKVNKDFIIGDSETLGNYHMVKVIDGVEVYEHEGTIFIKNCAETEIFCPNKNRHDTVTLPAGEWEVKKAREYDYLSGESRVVRD